MTWLSLELDTAAGTHRDTADPYECPSVRVCNDAAENGEPDPGPLFWLNSAAIRVDPDDDAIHLSASVADPRGAFVMTVRRLPDGRIVIHLPHVGQSMPHVETAELHGPGTLVLTHTAGDPDRAIVFDAPQGDDDDDDDDDDEDDDDDDDDDDGKGRARAR